MMKRTATTILNIELAAIQTGQAPEWVELFPAGPDIAARDGRRFTLPDPAAVIAAFHENKGPLAIDYEHAQAHRAPKGEEAPAAGWIADMEIRDGAVWGKVEWTERAADMVAAREYRFLSPEFLHDKAGRVHAIVGAGLVNRPAFVMTALSRQEDTDHPTPKETKMDLTALCRTLGLDTGASLDQILAAVDRLKEDKTTALAAAEKPDLERFVPRADYDAQKTKAEEATTALAAFKADQTKADADAAIEAAVKAGKIAPASRDHYRALCARDGGLDDFKKLVGTLPVIGDPSDLGEQQPGDKSAALTEGQRSICAAMGVSEEDYAKSLAAERT
ncbi:phage protease [Breoghania sp.]|uniref:phage protease n=1 Tax=Breoghania sp. TaxID=2065378 RepID=UPI002AA879E4|nr:phage protease [Breoghania sp.]